MNLSNVILGILDGFVDREDETGGLRRSSQSVDLDERRFPDALFHVVNHVLVQDVDTDPALTY